MSEQATATVLEINPKPTYEQLEALVAQQAVHINAITQEINELKDENEHLQTLNESLQFDDLTRLRKRRAAVSKFEESLQKEEDTHIFFLDLDNLKKINDRLGHQAGDSAIRHLVGVVNHNIRTIVDEAFRIDGDEFIIVSNTKDPEALKVRILQALSRKSWCWDGEEMKVSVAIGYASAAEGKNFSEVCAIADKRMYKHKNETK